MRLELQRPWPLLAFASVLVLGVTGAGLDRVQASWRISIAWQDESCDSVCAATNEVCTEACWPSTAPGIIAATTQPRLAGTCYAVQAGTEEAWHPSKDPENTVCYWNAGTPPGPRCALVPETPTEQSSQNRFIRRLCPCLNSTEELYARYLGLDCGIGGNPTLPVPGSSGSSSAATPAPTVSPSPPPATAAAPAAASPPRPSPAPSPPRPAGPRPPGAVTPVSAAWASAVTTGRCPQLCVHGFTAADEYLNGAYQRFETDMGFSHWSGSGHWLFQGDEGRWHFAEVPAEIAVASGTLVAQAGMDVPSSDFFVTATGGDQVRFTCCTGYTLRTEHATASLGSRAADEDESNEFDTGTLGLTLGILGSITAVGLAGVTVYMWMKPGACRGLKRSRARAYETMDSETSLQGKVSSPKEAEDLAPAGRKALPRQPRPPRLAGVAEEGAQPGMGTPGPRASAGSAGHASASPFSVPGAAAGLTSTGKSASWRAGPDALPQRGHGLPSQAPPPPQVPSNLASMAEPSGWEEDPGAAAVAAVLGRHAGPEASVREGPVKPWWGTAEATSTSKVSDFHMGMEVRLKGLVAQPTWNGTEGIIEVLDMARGQVQVRVPDGRVKAVRLENIEDASVPPAPVPGSRPATGAQRSMPGTPGPNFRTSASAMNGFSAAGPALPAGAQGAVRRQPSVGRAQSWRQGGQGEAGGGTPSNRSQRPSASAAGAAASRLPPLGKGGAGPGQGPGTPGSRSFPAAPQLPPPPAVPGFGTLPGQPGLRSAGPGNGARAEASTPVSRGSSALPQRGGGSPQRYDASPQRTGPVLPARAVPAPPRPARTPSSGGDTTASKSSALEDDLMQAQRSVQAQLECLQARLSKGLH